MMAQSNDFVGKDEKEKINASETAKRNCDILLNNFQIKKKRYRVLFNFDHIVWERTDKKQKTKNETNVKVNTKKETEIEREGLSTKDTYGSNNNIVHINEIIRVRKGDTKLATIRVDTQPQDVNNHSSESTIGITQNAQSSVMAITPTSQYLTIHYAERIVKSPTDCNRWQIRTLKLFNTDPYIVAQWYTLLSKKLEENPIRLRLRRLLVFINPYGGRKKGLQTYERHCKPIFQLAGIDASCIISQRANQIRDILLTHDLSPYDGICCVGGDGTAAEVINGLIFRAMRDSELDMRQPTYIPKPSFAIGIIPAGSTDTIAYSIHGTSDPQTSAIHVILGQRRGCDICSVSNRQGIIRFCASVCSYGYLGDVAACSEKYRWMGPKRYEYTGVKSFLKNRGYEAEIRLLETSIEQNEVDLPNTTSESVCYVNCQRCSSALSQSNAEDDVGNTGNTNLDCNTIYANSNWTINSDHSVDPNLSITDNALVGSDETSDALDITAYKTPDVTPERNQLPLPGHTINCDMNPKEDLKDRYNDENKSIDKCDYPMNVDEKKDTSTIKSQNSFSFCSTSPTSDKMIFNPSRNNFSTNDLAISSPPITPLPNVKRNLKWKTISGQFFMISCANITCACSRSPKGISPYNHLGDGQLDLILVRKTSILNNLRFALNTMGRKGDIRNLPFVELYRTNKMHFRAQYINSESEESIRASTQPIADAYSDDVTDKLVSSWNCDGEVVHDLDIVITSHCQLIDVFMRGPYSYKDEMNNGKSFCCCFTRS